MSSHCHFSAGIAAREIALKSLEFTADSESDTEQIGERLATVLRPGDVVALQGDLGAGKTRLVRAIVAALDGKDARVNSPTFVIIQRYDVRFPVDHIDAYRLADSEEFLALGGEEILTGDGICLIEWASRIGDVLPADHLRIEIIATSPQSRQINVQATGPRGGEIIEAMMSQ